MRFTKKSKNTYRWWPVDAATTLFFSSACTHILLMVPWANVQNDMKPSVSVCRCVFSFSLHAQKNIKNVKKQSIHSVCTIICCLLFTFCLRWNLFWIYYFASYEFITRRKVKFYTKKEVLFSNSLFHRAHRRRHFERVACRCWIFSSLFLRAFRVCVVIRWNL